MWSAEHRAAEQAKRANGAADSETTPRLLGRIALRLLLASGISYLLWRVLGLVGVVVTAPLFGVLLARPLIDLVSASRAAVKELALADLEGRHFAYRGVALDIAEDEDHRRWIRVADLRKLLPGFPRDDLLLRQYADDCRKEAAGLRFECDALLGTLARASNPATLRLKSWLEREVVAPSQKLRARARGSRREPPSPSRSPSPPP